jgi:hypothetical protein
MLLREKVNRRESQLFGFSLAPAWSSCQSRSRLPNPIGKYPMRCLRSEKRKAGLLGHFDCPPCAFPAQARREISLAKVKYAIDQFVQAPALWASSRYAAAE